MATKTKDKDKDPVTEEYRQLRNVVYTFFYYSNKPVNVAELVLQFKNYGKKAIEDVLADLVGKNKIFVRPCGKSKVYCLSQDMVYTVDDPGYADEDGDLTEDDTVLRFLKWKNAAINAELRALKNESRDLDAQIQSIDEEMSVDELKVAIRTMRRAVEEAGEREPGEYVDPALFAEKKKQLAAVEKEYAARRRIIKNIISTISDGLEMKQKDLMDEIGIEETK